MSNKKIDDGAAIYYMAAGAIAGAAGVVSLSIGAAGVLNSVCSSTDSSAVVAGVCSSINASAVVAGIFATATGVVGATATAVITKPKPEQDLPYHIGGYFSRVGAGLASVFVLSSALIVGEYSHDRVPSAPIVPSINDTANVQGIREINLSALQIK